MDQQEDLVEELVERLERKQRELTRLAEVEEEDRVPAKTQSNQKPTPSLNHDPDSTGQIEERCTAKGPQVRKGKALEGHQLLGEPRAEAMAKEGSQLWRRKGGQTRRAGLDALRQRKQANRDWSQASGGPQELGEKMSPGRLGEQGQDPGHPRVRNLPHSLQAPRLKDSSRGGRAPTTAGWLSVHGRGR